MQVIFFTSQRANKVSVGPLILNLTMFPNRLLLFIFGCLPLISTPSIILAQKFDNVWVMGYNWDNDAEAESYWLIFDTFPPRQENHPGYPHIGDAYAGICDSSGNLLLYTNNCFVADHTGALITGGDSMTTGWEFDWCKMYRWHPFDIQNIFLPMPATQDQIALFSMASYKSETGPLVVYQDKFKYSVIDLKADNGKPKVIMKNRIIIEDRLGYAQVTAVKHGNGQDWWLPMPVETGNKIYMVLLSKDTVYLHHEQSIGTSWGDSGGFQASFSPDGSVYARYNRFYGLYLYDFDRCDGILSNVRYFPYTTTTQGLQGGVGFSPDNRLLYFADYDSLYQVNLKVPDIAASKQLIAVYDSTIIVSWTKFSFVVPGPDGRVYVIPPSTSASMHVINRPNLRGVGCDVQQHFIEFPNPYGNPPNHPNYRLGPLDGSPCDTLGINNHPLADFRPDPTDTNALAVRFWDVSSYEPAEWLWDFGDPASGAANTSQDTSPVHLFSAPGFYTVCLTVANQYSASSKCKVVEVKTVGSSSPQGVGGSVILYPNPTTGMISLSGIDAVGCLVELFDVAGRKVFSQTLSDNAVDLTGLQAGLYFLRLSRPDEGLVGTSKVVISE